MKLSEHFKPFRENTIGFDKKMAIVTGDKTSLVYADWVASGRL